MQTNITIKDAMIEGSKSYTILNGEAPKQEQLWQQFTIDKVTPLSIVSYVEKHSEQNDFSNAVLIVNYRESSLRFISDVHRQGNVTINSVLRPSAPFINFMINCPGGRFNQDTFAQLLRRHGHYLTDESVRASLLKSCQSLRLKRNISNENINDRKSNITQSYQQVVTEKPFEYEVFDVTMPLFEGNVSTETFSVEIFYEALGNGLEITLESTYMYQLYEQKQKELLDSYINQILQYADKIVVITVA